MGRQPASDRLVGRTLTATLSSSMTSRSARSEVRTLADPVPDIGHRSFLVRLDDRRMDVAGPADGAGVAQGRGGRVDRLQHPGFDVEVPVDRTETSQVVGRDDRPAPRPEHLGRDVQTGGRAEVVVDVGGGEVDDLAVGALEGEELLAPQLVTAANGPGQARVTHGDLVLLPALALEAEDHLTFGDGGVIAPQRGQAVGAVVGGVLGVADPHQGLVEEAHDDGHHVVPVHRCADEDRPRPTSAGRAGAGEVEESVELVLVPDLLASAGGSGTACAPGRRGRWPGGDRCAGCRSTRRSRRAGSPGSRSSPGPPARPCRPPGPRRRTPRLGDGGGSPVGRRSCR